MGLVRVKAQFSSEQGFTLIEMMIVGVIVAFLMLGFSSYMYQQAKQGQNQSNKQNYTQLKSNVLNTSAQSDSISQSENMTLTVTPSPSP
jgi:prepilin-type N-terminal cleavage/methylation domain-containing protein